MEVIIKKFGREIIVDITESDKIFFDQLQLDTKLNELYDIPKATENSPEFIHGEIWPNKPISESINIERCLFQKKLFEWPKVFGNKKFFIYTLAD